MSSPSKQVNVHTVESVSAVEEQSPPVSADHSSTSFSTTLKSLKNLFFCISLMLMFLPGAGLLATIITVVSWVVQVFAGVLGDLGIVRERGVWWVRVRADFYEGVLKIFILREFNKMFFWSLGMKLFAQNFEFLHDISRQLKESKFQVEDDSDVGYDSDINTIQHTTDHVKRTDHVTDLTKHHPAATKTIKKAMILFTHASNLDATAVNLTTPWDFPMFAVGKKDLFFVPFVGYLFWICGLIGIDRKDRNKAITSLNSAQGKINQGHVFVVSPEGTRRRSPSLGKESLLEFKKGPFHLISNCAKPMDGTDIDALTGGRLSGQRLSGQAAAHKVESLVYVIPAIIAGSRSAWPGLPIQDSFLCIRYGPAIEFRGDVDYEEALKKTRDHFNQQYDLMTPSGNYSIKEACKMGQPILVNGAAILVVQAIFFWPATAICAAATMKMYELAVSYLL